MALGYLNAENFWNGKMKLNVDAARKSIQPIADYLNMSVEEASQAIFTTVNSCRCPTVR